MVLTICTRWVFATGNCPRSSHTGLVPVLMTEKQLRDLKPENCLFDSHNHLKIIDFGSADVVKSPFDNVCRKSYGRCGSGPYMPPEEFTDATYDGTKVDVSLFGFAPQISLCIGSKLN